MKQMHTHVSSNKEPIIFWLSKIYVITHIHVPFQIKDVLKKNLKKIRIQSKFFKFIYLDKTAENESENNWIFKQKMK